MLMQQFYASLMHGGALTIDSTRVHPYIYHNDSHLHPTQIAGWGSRLSWSTNAMLTTSLTSKTDPGEYEDKEGLLRL